MVSKLNSAHVSVYIAETSALVTMLLLVALSAPARNTPKEFSFETRMKECLPSGELRVNGVAFYNNRLYAGSGVGLLEITNAAVSKVYSWDKEFTEVAQPHHDTANELLWVRLPNLGKLAYYDGKSWHSVKRPKPKYGYISRAYALEGFIFTSSARGFYFQGGGHAWLWRDSKWVEQDNPPLGNPKSPLGLLKRLIPTDNRRYFLMRDEHDENMFWFQFTKRRGIPDAKLEGESAYFLAGGNWNLITNKAGQFYSAETAAVGKQAYIRTTAGELLELTERGIVKTSTPGFCEALATSQSGTLLASFRGKGIFELKGDWEKRLDSPFPTMDGGYEVHLATSGSEIALSISRSTDPYDEVETNIQSMIWITEGQEWRTVSLVGSGTSH